MDDRLKSPFAGAFAFSWMVINWRPVLYLFASSKPIEHRIAYVDAIYLSWWTTLWLPLIASLAALVSFYLLSSLYLALNEVYGVLRRWIEKKFDKARWIRPEDYIEFKRNYREQIVELQTLASDKLEQIDQLRNSARAADFRASEAESEKEGAVSDRHQLAATMANVSAQLEATQKQLRDMNRANERLKKDLEGAISSIDIEKGKAREEKEIRDKEILQLQSALAESLQFLVQAPTTTAPSTDSADQLGLRALLRRSEATNDARRVLEERIRSLLRK